MKPLAIIGLDPGTTSAYVILDLQEKVLRTFSAKELTLAAIITQVMEVCTPLYVSTDKAKVPSFVEEFARKVGAEVIAPEEDLQKEQKRNLLREYPPEIPSWNDHKKDCLAAALFSSQKLSNRLGKINHYIVLHGLQDKQEEFIKIALQKDYHFALIKDFLTAPPTEKNIVASGIEEEKITKKDFLALYEKFSEEKEKNINLQKTIYSLREHVKSLRKVNSWLQKRTQNVDAKIDMLFAFKEERLKTQRQQLQSNKKSLESLGEELKQLEQFIAFVPSYQLVKKLNTLSKDEFEAQENLSHFTDNDVLFVQHPEIYSEKVIAALKGKGIIILSPQKTHPVIFSQFQTGRIAADVFSHDRDHFALLERKELEKRMATKDFIQNLVEEYKESRKRKATLSLL